MTKAVFQDRIIASPSTNEATGALQSGFLEKMSSKTVNPSSPTSLAMSLGVLASGLHALDVLEAP